MNIYICYKEQLGFPVETVSVLASFCNYDIEKGKMRLDNGSWIYETMLPAGEYYYKFLINGSILLNDPEANCYVTRKEGETELWSYFRVAWTGERLYNNTPYHVTVSDYTLSSAISEGELAERHRYSSILDKRVVARFGFTGVTGIHPVTVLWCDYAGNIREYCEQMLLPEEGLATLWFWLNLEKQGLRQKQQQEQQLHQKAARHPEAVLRKKQQILQAARSHPAVKRW